MIVLRQFLRGIIISTLKQYIRKEQNLLIYIYTSDSQWELYDPSLHGCAERIENGYIVAYPNGEIMADAVNTNATPPGTYYIEEMETTDEVMPLCIDSALVEIRHCSSINNHADERYCTIVRNIGDVPFKVKRFAAFSMRNGEYRLSTISNTWFSNTQFQNWFNQTDEWITPNMKVADQDNYGYGNGYWVFEIQFQSGDTVFIRSKLPQTTWYFVKSPKTAIIFAGIIVFIMLIVICLGVKKWIYILVLGANILVPCIEKLNYEV